MSPSGKKETLNVRRESVDSVGDYEADEFEKDDLVQIAEPQKP